MTALNAAPADTRPSAPYQWLTRYPKGVDWHRQFAPAPLYELLDAATVKYGSRPCTNFLGKVHTYRDIARMVDRAATGLQKLGVTKGTKVGLFLPNCPTYIVYYFATLKAGGTVVNYNPLYTLEELTFGMSTIDDAQQRSALRLHGDRELFESLLRLFAVPAPTE